MITLVVIFLFRTFFSEVVQLTSENGGNCPQIKTVKKISIVVTTIFKQKFLSGDLPMVALKHKDGLRQNDLVYLHYF